MQQRRFVGLWQRLGGNGGVAPQVFAELFDRYAAPGRYYHTPRHVTHCLRQFDAARHEIPHPDEVELALWFHDVIYRPKAADNEHRSIELFLDLGHDLPCHTRQKICELIMATIHPCSPRQPDRQAVTDIDLSSFARPWSEFLRDSRDVRAEFGHLSDDLFICGQKAFLRRLLDRERFFLTPYFHDRFEAQARDNIYRYMELMRAPPALH